MQLIETVLQDRTGTHAVSTFNQLLWLAGQGEVGRYSPEWQNVKGTELKVGVNRTRQPLRL